MDSDSVRLSPRSVRGDHEAFVSGAAQMLEHSKHGIGDTVDIREEGLCDDRNAHTVIVPAASVVKVAARGWTHENSGAHSIA